MHQELLLKQIEGILSEFENLVSRARYDDLSDISSERVEDVSTLITKAKAAVSRITGTSSEYYKDILTYLDSRNHAGTKLRLIIGSIKALKGDIENGYLKRLHDIIQAVFFSNYLEMASYLFTEGYKDAATVIVGSTLEAHLRELCKSNEIEVQVLNGKDKLVPKKAETMNTELSKKGVYTLAYQKQITTWLDIRNSAAHGHYDQYSIEESKLMLQGVQQFILATTA